MRFTASDRLWWISSHRIPTHVSLSPPSNCHSCENESAEGEGRSCFAEKTPSPAGQECVCECMRHSGNIKTVTRFLFVPGCHLLSHYSLPFLCRVCVLVWTCECVSHPGDYRYVALPWRTRGCHRWRCVVVGAGAFWRSRCIGAEKSACCGRWGGGRSSWRALKHKNKRHHSTCSENQQNLNQALECWKEKRFFYSGLTSLLFKGHYYWNLHWIDLYSTFISNSTAISEN